MDTRTLLHCWPRRCGGRGEERAHMHARRVDGEWSGGGKRGQRGKGRRSTERRNGGEWSGGGREGRKHEKRREEKRAVIRLAKSVCYLRPKINERRAEFGRLSERIGGAIRLVWKTGRASHRRLQHEKQPRPVGLGRSGSRPPSPRRSRGHENITRRTVDGPRRT